MYNYSQPEGEGRVETSCVSDMHPTLENMLFFCDMRPCSPVVHLIDSTALHPSICYKHRCENLSSHIVQFIGGVKHCNESTGNFL
jgi:hypothetical protein